MKFLLSFALLLSGIECSVISSASVSSSSSYSFSSTSTLLGSSSSIFSTSSTFGGGLDSWSGSSSPSSYDYTEEHEQKPFEDAFLRIERPSFDLFDDDDEADGIPVLIQVKNAFDTVAEAAEPVYIPFSSSSGAQSSSSSDFGDSSSSRFS